MPKQSAADVDNMLSNFDLAFAMARDVLGWSEEELKMLENADKSTRDQFLKWIWAAMARNMDKELTAAATNDGDEKQPLMQKISGPSHINIKDFTAILLFQERHPDLFTDTPAKDMFAQMDAFNRLFEGSYADEFKTILRELSI